VFRCILKCQGEAGTVKFCVLASGSSGNAALLPLKYAYPGGCGLSMKELRSGWRHRRRSRAVDAIVITHEHSIMWLGCRAGAQPGRPRGHVPDAPGRAGHRLGETQPARLEPFQAGASFQIDDIAVQSFGIPHDAVDPVGFLFRRARRAHRVVTDLGYIPSPSDSTCGARTCCCSNRITIRHAESRPYPWSVKQRVMSRVGHLSNLGCRTISSRT